MYRYSLQDEYHVGASRIFRVRDIFHAIWKHGVCNG